MTQMNTITPQAAFQSFDATSDIYSLNVKTFLPNLSCRRMSAMLYRGQLPCVAGCCTVLLFALTTFVAISWSPKPSSSRGQLLLEPAST